MGLRHRSAAAMRPARRLVARGCIRGRSRRRACGGAAAQQRRVWMHGLPLQVLKQLLQGMWVAFSRFRGGPED